MCRFFLVFWELPVQLRPLITFPCPDQDLLNFKYSYFSPLFQVFWIFWQLTVQLGLWKFYWARFCWNSKFRNFLPAALTICSWRHRVNWWSFNQKIASRFFGFNIKVSSISSNLGEKIVPIYFLVVLRNETTINR